jgi:single-strand DNA-binding protein
MANDAHFSVTGFIATQPKSSTLKGGTTMLRMRVGWTPRVMDRNTGEWTDQQTSFVSVTCYRKVAEHGAMCLRRGDPVMLIGSLQVREYTDQAGVRRNSVDVVADNISHDMSRGISNYSKASPNAGPTAKEYELSMAAERDPLPGDIAALRPPDELDPADLADPADELDDADEADEADLADQADRQPEDEGVGALV